MGHAVIASDDTLRHQTYTNSDQYPATPPLPVRIQASAGELKADVGMPVSRVGELYAKLLRLRDNQALIPDTAFGPRV